MSSRLPKLEGAIGVMITTPLFFLLFLGIVFWVYRKKGKSLYEDIGRLPLDDNQEPVDKEV